MQHKWFLTFEAVVPDQLSELPAKDRMAVFRSIATLLIAENPTLEPGVKKLVDKRFEGLWRQRQGDYRILFELQPGILVYLGVAYKGKLHLVAVRHRSQAYRD